MGGFCPEKRVISLPITASYFVDYVGSILGHMRNYMLSDGGDDTSNRVGDQLQMRNIAERYGITAYNDGGSQRGGGGGGGYGQDGGG